MAAGKVSFIWGVTPRGREFGYIRVTTVGPLEPIEHA